MKTTNVSATKLNSADSGKAQNIKSKEADAAKDSATQNSDTQKIKELTELLQRVQAEFENYQKRIERERKEFACFANEKLIQDILVIMDDFEKALPAINDKGVKMIYSKLAKLLQNYAVTPVSTKGEKFNAFKHEVLCACQTNDCPDGTILEEIQRGYEMNGKIIRYAKVKVAKAASEQKPADDKTNDEKINNTQNIQTDNGGLKK